MQMIYNSPNYCVVEFPPQEGPLAMKSGGYEIVDKNMQQFRNPGKQVILSPAKWKSGDLVSPFEVART